PPPGGTLVGAAGRHRLYSVPTSGLLQVADTTAPIVTSRQDIDVAMGAFLRSDAAARGEYPLLTIDGVQHGTPTLTGTSAPTTPAGTVQLVYGPGRDGVVGATITANRPPAVLL